MFSRLSARAVRPSTASPSTPLRLQTRRAISVQTAPSDQNVSDFCISFPVVAVVVTSLARVVGRGDAKLYGAACIHLSSALPQTILHGSPEAKAEGDVSIQQHSRLVARGKYVHGFEVHRVKPDAVEEYKKAAEGYYATIKDDPELHVKLTGSWETVVGEQDTFYHILEYENYDGYDKTVAKIRNSEHIHAYNKMIPYLNSRSSSLCQEFNFFPTAPPHTEGGIFELRRDLKTRKELREKAWQQDGWSDTVTKTSQYSKFMDSLILQPLPYSPLK
ncbi:hypothetical protein EUX98_g2214 [Antrodiella citrinella]|uniref:NIPSNAP domain-containing protein n=1 Tax=Antrodiella citrinella TaxID=2447956 RepID=A0A4S4N7T4_9APHY|nr:hypothetical protein EUX98_g2214 [Antrodiella citrinella]